MEKEPRTYQLAVQLNQFNASAATDQPSKSKAITRLPIIIPEVQKEDNSSTSDRISSQNQGQSQSQSQDQDHKVAHPTSTYKQSRNKTITNIFAEQPAEKASTSYKLPEDETKPYTIVGQKEVKRYCNRQTKKKNFTRRADSMIDVSVRSSTVRSR